MMDPTKTLLATSARPLDKAATGLVVVDHGSRREESNLMHEQFVAMFAQSSDYAIIEPAHMELAEPSIQTAFDRCVQRGARQVVVVPYFLLPGRHWDKDIPALTAQAAARHPQIGFLVSAPIGLHPLMTQVIQSRVDHCLQRAGGQAEECDMCAGSGRCTLRTA